MIFNHIFWDGTFFYGEDVFSTYREWFLETIKVAHKNKNIHWLLNPILQTKFKTLDTELDEITEKKK